MRVGIILGIIWGIVAPKLGFGFDSPYFWGISLIGAGTIAFIASRKYF